ncbi:MAG: pilus assembly protein, partial [Rhizobiales bacterium 35-66-30]
VEMEIPDEQLDAICEEIAARFRKTAKGKAPTGPSAP